MRITPEITSLVDDSDHSAKQAILRAVNKLTLDVVRFPSDTKRSSETVQDTVKFASDGETTCHDKHYGDVELVKRQI